MPELKAVLIGFGQKLREVADFSFHGDVMPDVLARRWMARLEETEWCLAQVCQNAAVSMEVQQTIMQFTYIPRDCQTARRLLTFSRIIYISMKLCSAATVVTIQQIGGISFLIQCISVTKKSGRYELRSSLLGLHLCCGQLAICV